MSEAQREDAADGMRSCEGSAVKGVRSELSQHHAQDSLKKAQRSVFLRQLEELR